MKPWWNIYITPINMHTRLAGPYRQLHELDHKIRRALKDSLVTHGYFLVIKGAFYDTVFESMCKTAEEYGQSDVW